MSDASDITVVIPAFNRERLIGRAVSSALRQEPVPPAQVIVVDDGSSDGSADAAAGHGALVIRNAHGGQGAARNVGLAQAHTKWVAFLDSDDEWLPEHLHTMSPYLSAERVLVSTNAVGVPSRRLIGQPSAAPAELTQKRIIWPDSPCSMSNVVVNRLAALSIGGFDGRRYGEDKDFYFRLLSCGAGLALPEVTAIIHEHQSQISTSRLIMRTARRDFFRDYAAAGRIDALDIRRASVADAWDQLKSPEKKTAPELVRYLKVVAQDRVSVLALVEMLVYRRRLRLFDSTRSARLAASALSKPTK